MKTKNKPVFISLARRFRLIAENVPAQPDSGIYKLGDGTMGLMRVMGVMRLMGGKPKQQRSPAQPDSGISILGVGSLGILRSLGMMGKKTKNKNSPAQQDSGIYLLEIGQTSLTGPTSQTKQQLTPAQRHSKMSNGRLSGMLCWPHGRKIKTAPAQRHSGMSNLGMGLMGPMGPIGLMGQKPVMKNAPAQPDSEISNLKIETENAPAQRHSIMSNLKTETENSLPQRHSKMSNGRLSGVLCWPHGQRTISTMQIKNIGCRFMVGWDYWRMGQHKTSPVQRDSRISILGMGLMGPMGLMDKKTAMKNSPAQQDSGISNLKIETETAPAQLDSIMSNGRLSGVLCWPHGRKTKNAPAQLDSIMSNLGDRPYCPLCPYCPLGFKNSSAQQDSKMSNRRAGLICRWRNQRLRTATSGQSGFP